MPIFLSSLWGLNPLVADPSGLLNSGAGFGAGSHECAYPYGSPSAGSGGTKANYEHVAEMTIDQPPISPAATAAQPHPPAKP